jgi:hypothetical protein
VGANARARAYAEEGLETRARSCVRVERARLVLPPPAVLVQMLMPMLEALERTREGASEWVSESEPGRGA